MAGAYAVLKRPADVPNPTTDAAAATRRAGAIVKTCTTVRGRTTAVVLERSFGVLFFLRILLVRAVLVVAFNVMTDAPALRMRRRRRSRRGGLVVGVGISLASAHYGKNTAFRGCKDVRKKTKKQKRERKRNEEDEFICGFRGSGAKCAKLYCMSSIRSSLRALLI